MRCEVIAHESALGPFNMAADEVLLGMVEAAPERGVLRTYEWSEPTLSLGYFQSWEAARAIDASQRVCRVRRITGGGAIWHDQEITYALAMPRQHPACRDVEALYDCVHDHIRNRLNQAGFPVKFRPGDVETPGGERPFLCFQDQSTHDLVLGSRKVVGSAQRRKPRAVLQHGSVLLRASSLLPRVPGIAEGDASIESLREIVISCLRDLPASLGMDGSPASWSDGEQRRIVELAAGRYATAGWTRRR